ncbi:MAG: 2-amino-4-hydroxy-6-hydroxymethyldihydropteridine diphosphokinase [Candidatus Pelagadaptatus aseana]|uniref:2-amino-4-hydroxy-6- hydroxymethyldihydropteridine diphosphokinase n=1 Tax=Candidatus Pelagadaptatus aseana TaxID=3120508 RepID=UPI0039B13499
MATVYLSLGSNIQRYRHLTAALDALCDQFGELTISPVYESEAVGFDGDHFLNLVVGIETALPVGELSAVLKAIEDDNGRDRSCPRFSGRTLDIDILTYDQVTGEVDGVDLPREEITENAFVLLPLADIAGDAVHPLIDRRYGDLWRDYDRNQKLWSVDFDWRGRKISKA